MSQIEGESSPPKHKKKSRSFRSVFLTGLFIVLPLLVTYWVVKFMFSQVNTAVTPLVLHLIRLLGLGAWLEVAWGQFLAPLFSVTLAILLIYTLGLFGGFVVGRQLLAFFENRVLLQLPIVRSIYSATRQFIQTFSSQSGRSFRRVVLVEYPRKDLWTMALVTNDDQGEVNDLVDTKLLSVFVPTTPNPTSGWLLFVPSEDVIELKMSVDDAFKLIISGGVLTPEREPLERT